MGSHLLMASEMNNYDLLSEIGKGMAGTVHLVRDKSSGELKVNFFEGSCRSYDPGQIVRITSLTNHLIRDRTWSAVPDALLGNWKNELK